MYKKRYTRRYSQENIDASIAPKEIDTDSLDLAIEEYHFNTRLSTLSKEMSNLSKQFAIPASGNSLHWSIANESSDFMRSTESRMLSLCTENYKHSLESASFNTVIETVKKWVKALMEYLRTLAGKIRALIKRTSPDVAQAEKTGVKQASELGYKEYRDISSFSVYGSDAHLDTLAKELKELTQFTEKTEKFVKDIVSDISKHNGDNTEFLAISNKITQFIINDTTADQKKRGDDITISRRLTGSWYLNGDAETKGVGTNKSIHCIWSRDDFAQTSGDVTDNSSNSVGEMKINPHGLASALGNLEDLVKSTTDVVALIEKGINDIDNGKHASPIASSNKSSLIVKLKQCTLHPMQLLISHTNLVGTQLDVLIKSYKGASDAKAE